MALRRQDLLLDIADLCVVYKENRGVLQAIDRASLAVGHDEVVGITGESGCGKSTLAASILRILPQNAEVTSGRILFRGIDLRSLSEAEMRKIRWKQISIIFQNAMNALDPVYKIKDLLKEALCVHEGMPDHEIEGRIKEVLNMVRISQSRMDSYPHELSGGMRQRVMIAMASICRPQLVIADEFTTGLDVVVQDQILADMQDLRQKLGFAMILITHDLSVILETCDRVAVMYGGSILETADSESILQDPRHPYTRALLECMPTIRDAKKKLKSLSGSPPDMLNPPKGCRFLARCTVATQLCQSDPPNLEVGHNRYSRCHYALEQKQEKMRIGPG